jgi:hypothetical protein
VSQQVRFAPGSSLDCVYVRHGHVTVSRADGSEVTIAPGHHPAWEEPDVVVFCPPEDGVVQQWVGGVPHNGGELQILGRYVPTVPAGNTLTASAGKVAVHRTDPRRVLTSWGAGVMNATDPVLSADGAWMAYLLPDSPVPNVATVAIMAVGSLVERRVYTGAPLRPRFSHAGTTLCWEEAGGAIFGIRDVANPTSPVVRLSRPGDQCYHPVPLWCPERSELLLCYVQAVSDTEADVIVAGWESCVAQQPSGYVVARSGGSGFDLDAKEAA